MSDISSSSILVLHSGEVLQRWPSREASHHRRRRYEIKFAGGCESCLLKRARRGTITTLNFLIMSKTPSHHIGEDNRLWWRNSITDRTKSHHVINRFMTAICSSMLLIRGGTKKLEESSWQWWWWQKKILLCFFKCRHRHQRDRELRQITYLIQREFCTLLRVTSQSWRKNIEKFNVCPALWHRFGEGGPTRFKLLMQKSTLRRLDFWSQFASSRHRYESNERV